MFVKFVALIGCICVAAIHGMGLSFFTDEYYGNAYTEMKQKDSAYSSCWLINKSTKLPTENPGKCC